MKIELRGRGLKDLDFSSHNPTTASSKETLALQAVDTIDASENQISIIRKLDVFTTLKSLSLSSNRLVSPVSFFIRQLPTRTLVKLDLSHNSIASIEGGAAGEYTSPGGGGASPTGGGTGAGAGDDLLRSSYNFRVFSVLEELNLSFNTITCPMASTLSDIPPGTSAAAASGCGGGVGTLLPMFFPASLRRLNVGHNRIYDIGPFIRGLVLLETLNAEGNLIASAKGLEELALGSCGMLKKLYLDGNPCVPLLGNNYRRLVLDLLREGASRTGPSPLMADTVDGQQQPQHRHPLELLDGLPIVVPSSPPPGQHRLQQQEQEDAEEHQENQKKASLSQAIADQVRAQQEKLQQAAAREASSPSGPLKAIPRAKAVVVPDRHTEDYEIEEATQQQDYYDQQQAEQHRQDGYGDQSYFDGDEDGDEEHSPHRSHRHLDASILVGEVSPARGSHRDHRGGDDEEYDSYSNQEDEDEEHSPHREHHQSVLVDNNEDGNFDDYDDDREDEDEDEEHSPHRSHQHDSVMVPVDEEEEDCYRGGGRGTGGQGDEEDEDEDEEHSPQREHHQSVLVDNKDHHHDHGGSSYLVEGAYDSPYKSSGAGDEELYDEDDSHHHHDQYEVRAHSAMARAADSTGKRKHKYDGRIEELKRLSLQLEQQLMDTQHNISILHRDNKKEAAKLSHARQVVGDQLKESTALKAEQKALLKNIDVMKRHSHKSCHDIHHAEKAGERQQQQSVARLQREQNNRDKAQHGKGSSRAGALRQRSVNSRKLDEQSGNAQYPPPKMTTSAMKRQEATQRKLQQQMELDHSLAQGGVRSANDEYYVAVTSHSQGGGGHSASPPGLVQDGLLVDGPSPYEILGAIPLHPRTLEEKEERSRMGPQDYRSPRRAHLGNAGDRSHGSPSREWDSSTLGGGGGGGRTHHRHSAPSSTAPRSGGSGQLKVPSLQ